MKMNKTVGRVATTLVATAMLASLAAVPAFAETTNNNGVITDSTTGKVSSIVFTKDLVMPASVGTPNITFSFDLTGATADQVGVNETASDSTTTVKVLPGNGHGSLSDVAVEFDEDSEKTDSAGTGTDATVTVSETVTLNLTTTAGFSFSEPGVYKYILSEDAVTDTNYTTSANYTVYLYVERVEHSGSDDTYEITGATMFSGPNEDTSKTGEMTNYYLIDDDGNVVANSLTVDKIVTGDMGNKSNEFAFTVTITAKDNAVNRNYTATNATVENKNDGTYTVTGSLHDGESLTINGLINGDTYSIDETAADQDGYTTSVAKKSGMDNTTVTNSDGTSTLKNESVVTFNADDGADAVTYTNDRAAVSPTGIVMNVAPYALLVVIAAAGCFVFLRKRRED